MRGENDMKALIAYSTKYGATEKCAQVIKEKLNCEVKLINLKSNLSFNVKDYDIILLGGSVYAGNTQKELKAFIEKRNSDLIKKHIGLFLSCGQESSADKYFKDLFTEQLYNHAFSKTYMGYAYYFNKMNFIERTIVKKMVKLKDTVEKIEYDNIEILVEKVNNIINHS